MGRWELWERTWDTGHSALFFDTSQEDADERRGWAADQGMTLQWATMANGRREAHRALSEWNPGRYGPKSPSLTAPARHVIAMATDAATAFHHRFVEPEHVLLALMQAKDTVAGRLLAESGVQVEAAKRLVATSPAAPGNEASKLTNHLVGVTEAADRYAEALGQEWVGTPVLLAALLEDREHFLVSALVGLGIDPARLRERALEVANTEPTESP